MLVGLLPAMGSGNSVITPPGVIRPIAFPVSSVNHRFPSGPAVIALGALAAAGRANSSIVPTGAIAVAEAAAISPAARTTPRSACRTDHPLMTQNPSGTTTPRM